jgi:hypothetical protein
MEGSGRVKPVLPFPGLTYLSEFAFIVLKDLN